jgi:hypothetical protein
LRLTIFGELLSASQCCTALMGCQPKRSGRGQLSGTVSRRLLLDIVGIAGALLQASHGAHQKSQPQTFARCALPGGASLFPAQRCGALLMAAATVNTLD